MTYDIYDQRNGELESSNMTLGFVAAVLGLDKHEVLWAIEECGRCDDGTRTIVPHGDPKPAPFDGVPQ